MNDDQFEKLMKKIDILIKLTAMNTFGDRNLKEKVQMLSGLGLKPIEIARVLGKSKNYVYVTLSHLRKEERAEESNSNSENNLEKKSN